MTATPPVDQLDFALGYLRRGASVIDVPYRSKNPNRPGWQAERLTEGDLRGRFDGVPKNLGLLLGEPSAGRVDVDLDSCEVLVLADDLLPGTHSVFGRPTKRRSHRVYLADPLVPTVRFRDPLHPEAEGMLVELRSTGCQTLVPPSVHPNGEPIAWEADGEPARVDGRILRRAVARLAAAGLLVRYYPAPGGRHDAMNALAGGLLRGGWGEDEAVRFILAVAKGAGDEEARGRPDGVRSTVRRLAGDQQAIGWPTLATLVGERVVASVCDWLEMPRETRAPERNPGGVGAPMASSPPTPRLVRLSAVRPEPVRWLWPGRVPRGKLTILVGDPGLGKSFITLDMVATLTARGAWPDGGSVGPGVAVILTAEDGLGDTVRPRLDAMGADAARVVALTGVVAAAGEPERAFQLATDIEALEAAIRETGADLAILDPINAYLAGVDSHSAAEVRGVLAPLAAMAERTGAAVVIVHHLNKGASANALYRAGGSLDFVAAARSVLGVAEDPDDKRRRLLLSIKLNLAEQPPGLGYRVADGRLHWDAEPVTVDASAAFSPPSAADGEGGRAAAEQFLAAVLAGGRVPAKDVRAEARVVGISDRTLDRAKDKLGVLAERDGFGPGAAWYWSLPPSIERQNGHRAPVKTVAPYGGRGVLWLCACRSLERRHRPEFGDWVCDGCGVSAPPPSDGGRP